MAKKKILIFSLAYYPFVGGAETAIKEITDRIGDEFSFDMVTLRFDSNLPRTETIGNVAVHRIGFTKNAPTFSELRSFPLHINKILFQFMAAIKAHQLHRKKKYDAVWAMMAHSTGVPVAIFNLLHPSIPYMLTLQEGDKISWITFVMLPFYPLFKRAFTQAAVVQVISTYLGKWAKRMGFAGQVSVTPNGVDIGVFVSTPKTHAAFLKEIYKTDTGNVYLVTVSRLVPKNAVDDVIKSLKYLPPHIKFLILGTGPDEHALKKLAAREGVESRVFFIGYVEYKNIPSYFNISRVFIRPSLSEGMGSAFVEAMAFGLPVIGTNVGGIPDFLKDGETGFFCEMRDPKSIALRAAYILDPKNKARISRVIARAKKVVEQNHDWNKNAEKIRALFKTIA